MLWARKEREKESMFIKFHSSPVSKPLFFIFNLEIYSGGYTFIFYFYFLGGVGVGGYVNHFIKKNQIHFVCDILQFHCNHFGFKEKLSYFQWNAFIF